MIVSIFTLVAAILLVCLALLVINMVLVRLIADQTIRWVVLVIIGIGIILIANRYMGFF